MGEAAPQLTTTFIPFTRIKGISDKRRIPIIGKIRLGVKVNGKNGMYPMETPYFVVPPEIQAKYGEKPTELDIIFPVEDDERIFPQALKLYGMSGLKCIGNGEQAKRLNERTFHYDPVPCTCDYFTNGECGERGNLLVFIPSVSPGGLYQIDSGSVNAMKNLNGYFEFLRNTIGRIANIPLKLRRVPYMTRYKGQPSTHYPLELRYVGSPDLTEQLKRETPEVLARLKTVEIQEPIDINPATDPDATIVAEEDLANIMTITNAQPTSQPVPPSTEQPVTPVNPAAPSADVPSPNGNGKNKLPDPMTPNQRQYILSLVEPKHITEAQVDTLTHGYNKRQASALIDQLKTGDFSGFEELGEEQVPLNEPVDRAPEHTSTPTRVEF